MKAALKGVPETTLWTLHNRASEAMRPDGAIQDPKCVDIYKAIDYDYKKSFGAAGPTHALRSNYFDRQLEAFLSQHPGATVVNLGEGLETQRFRIKGDYGLWLTVDLPESIEIRERFIQPDAKHQHLPLSALDRSWMDYVPRDQPVFVAAQGLFMYFRATEVRHLFQDLLEELPWGMLLFDVIPKWFSKRTTSEKGFAVTPHYVAPPMPWGLNAHQAKKLKAWSPNIKRVTAEGYLNLRRGLQGWFWTTLMNAPILRNRVPAVVKITF